MKRHFYNYLKELSCDAQYKVKNIIEESTSQTASLPTVKERNEKLKQLNIKRDF